MKAGSIRVWLRRGEAATLGHWLVNVAAIEWPDQRAFLEGVGNDLLRRSRRRRRGDLFEVIVKREVAEWFDRLSKQLGAWTSLDTWRLIPGPVREAAARLAPTRRGRPRLSVDDMEARLSDDRSIDERHRQKLRRRYRYDRACDDWYAEIERRGETALTTDIPPPKF